MTADHMGDFMGENPGQFIFAGHNLKQAGVDKNMPGRQGECVVDLVPDDVKVVGEGLGGKFGKNFTPDALNIIQNKGIVDEFVVI